MEKKNTYFLPFHHSCQLPKIDCWDSRQLILCLRTIHTPGMWTAVCHQGSTAIFYTGKKSWLILNTTNIIKSHRQGKPLLPSSPRVKHRNLTQRAECLICDMRWGSRHRNRVIVQHKISTILKNNSFIWIAASPTFTIQTNVFLNKLQIQCNNVIIK